MTDKELSLNHLCTINKMPNEIQITNGMVERYIASIQQEHDRWNTFREQAMDRQQFTLVARYGDVCDALKMAINQARKILLPNEKGEATAPQKTD